MVPAVPPPWQKIIIGVKSRGLARSIKCTEEDLVLYVWVLETCEVLFSSWYQEHLQVRTTLVVQWLRLHFHCRRCGFDPQVGELQWRSWKPKRGGRCNTFKYWFCFVWGVHYLPTNVFLINTVPRGHCQHLLAIPKCRLISNFSEASVGLCLLSAEGTEMWAPS